MRVISIPTQTQLRLHSGGDYGIATISDADGDGVRDYLISNPSFNVQTSFAALYSGRTGERLHSYYDPDSVYFMGGSVADVGDLDHDGRAEVVIGSPLHINAASLGSSLIYSGNGLWLNAEPKMPLAGDVESLIVHGAPTGNPVAIFLTDVNGAPMVTLLGIGTSDSVEAFILSGTVPAGLAGMTMTFHSFALDARSKLMSSADERIYFQ